MNQTNIPEIVVLILIALIGLGGGGFLWHYASDLDILFKEGLPVDHDPDILFAGEYRVFSLVSSELFLRAGYNFKNQSELGFMGGFSSGFGIRINALTLDLAVKLAKYNIQVNGIAPGYFDTDMVAYAKQEKEF